MTDSSILLWARPILSLLGVVAVGAIAVDRLRRAEKLLNEQIRPRVHYLENFTSYLYWLLHELWASNMPHPMPPMAPPGPQTSEEGPQRRPWWRSGA